MNICGSFLYKNYIDRTLIGVKNSNEMRWKLDSGSFFGVDLDGVTVSSYVSTFNDNWHVLSFSSLFPGAYVLDIWHLIAVMLVFEVCAFIH